MSTEPSCVCCGVPRRIYDVAGHDPECIWYEVGHEIDHDWKALTELLAGTANADEAEAQSLIVNGYYSVSSKYRMLARLPSGMTGHQALVAAVGSSSWVKHLAPDHAAGQFMRCFSSREPWRQECSLTVSDDVFRHFKRLGGQAAR